MKFIISEKKIEKTINDFFEIYFKNIVEGYRDGQYDPLVFFHMNEHSEDDEEFDYVVIRYFKTAETYDEYHNDFNTYSWDEFPMLEMDYLMYNKLIEMFPEKLFKNNFINWFNKKFNLDVKTINPN